MKKTFWPVAALLIGLFTTSCDSSKGLFSRRDSDDRDDRRERTAYNENRDSDDREGRSTAGRERRSELGDDVRNRSREVRDDVRDTGREVGNDVRERTDNVRDDVRDKARNVREDVRDKAQNVKEDIREKAPEVKEDARRVAGELKQDATNNRLFGNGPDQDTPEEDAFEERIRERLGLSSGQSNQRNNDQRGNDQRNSDQRNYDQRGNDQRSSDSRQYSNSRQYSDDGSYSDNRSGNDRYSSGSQMNERGSKDYRQDQSGNYSDNNRMQGDRYSSNSSGNYSGRESRGGSYARDQYSQMDRMDNRQSDSRYMDNRGMDSRSMDSRSGDSRQYDERSSYNDSGNRDDRGGNYSEGRSGRSNLDGDRRELADRIGSMMDNLDRQIEQMSRNTSASGRSQRQATVRELEKQRNDLMKAYYQVQRGSEQNWAQTRRQADRLIYDVEERLEKMDQRTNR